MKKTIITAIVILMTMNLFAQSQIEKEGNDAYQRIENCIITYRYRLFPTEDTWTFIKLNTRTGQMWQVQFDEKEKNRFETSLNNVSLVEKQKEVDNRFTLYSTQNLWTFILLDQIDGKTWQVKWSKKPDERRIIPIE